MLWHEECQTPFLCLGSKKSIVNSVELSNLAHWIWAIINNFLDPTAFLLALPVKRHYAPITAQQFLPCQQLNEQCGSHSQAIYSTLQGLILFHQWWCIVEFNPSSLDLCIPFNNQLYTHPLLPDHTVWRIFLLGRNKGECNSGITKREEVTTLKEGFIAYLLVPWDLNIGISSTIWDHGGRGFDYIITLLKQMLP